MFWPVYYGIYGGGAAVPVYYAILDAVYNALRELHLSWIDRDNIRVAKVLNERETVFPRLPGILVLPLGNENIPETGGTTSRDDIGYPVAIVMLDQDRKQKYSTGAESEDPETGEEIGMEDADPGTQDQDFRYTAKLMWRQTIRRRFLHQRLRLPLVVEDVNRTTIEPGAVVSAPDWLRDNIWMSTLVFRFWVRETRLGSGVVEPLPDPEAAQAPEMAIAPVAIEEDDMVDFEDIGGVYDDSSSAVMSANVLALNNFLALQPRPAVRFGGPINSVYGNKRIAGTAYFNAAIVIPGAKPVIFDGANSILAFQVIAGATAGIDLGEGGAGIERLIKDFRLDSTGSGIRLDAPGRGTVLQNLRIYPSGTGVLDYDAFTDSATAPYGLKIYDGAGGQTPDGVRIDGVQIFDSGGHGIFVPDGLNAGSFIGRVHNAAGTGFKAQKLNGCDISKIVSESNYAWGFHLQTCGTGNYAGGLSGGDTDIPNDADFWMENNNWRGSPYSSGGHGTRQFRVRNSGAMKIKGHTGWGSNKCDLDEGSRNNCTFESGRWIACPAATPKVQLSTGSHVLPADSGSPSSNNLATTWPNASFRPVVEDIAGEFVITIPPDCFDNATGTFAYWRPWGLASLFTSQTGDMVSYEVEVSGDAALVAWCVGREETSSPRQGSDCCEFQIAPVAGGKSWPGLYNLKRRKFMGRIVMGEVRTDVGPSIILWSDGFQNQANYPQSNEMVLTIHNWKFYVTRADGSAV